MTNRAALVTGAGARIGRAMALDLAAFGHDLVIHYHTSKSGAEEVAHAACRQGVSAVALCADFLDPDAVRQLMGRATRALGKEIGILINNASLFSPNTLETATEADWAGHVETNLHAPFILTQCFARQFAPDLQRDANDEVLAKGMIVNMIDQCVLNPGETFATYTLAKMALWDLTRTSAISLAPHIRVNAIGPGPTLPASRQTAENFARLRCGTLLERGGNLEDVLAALRFLLSCPAVTGQLICVDGGQHLQ